MPDLLIIRGKKKHGVNMGLNCEEVIEKRVAVRDVTMLCGSDTDKDIRVERYFV